MNDKQQVHPARDTLAAYGLGKLEPAEADAVETHIADCEACCETLLDLQSDTFVDLVRRSDAVKLEAEASQVDDGTVAFPDASREATFDLPEELTEHTRYRVFELLGHGGMGDVYKAEHKLMNRLVALKLINQKLVQNSQAVERFRREVQSAAQLSHPNIVTAHDAEQAGDVHYLVMEYVEGTDLSELVKQSGPVPVDLACDYICQAAAGLQHAHQKGMVHRDIKPHNLMVTVEGQVKILDFGLATLAITDEDSGTSFGNEEEDIESSRLTSIGAMMGTPDYISPEQAADAREADIRSDIYSLGATLYFLLTGHPPFAKEAVMQKLAGHASSEPEPIETVRVDVPDELAVVLRRMMAKEPDARFGTPAEVADALAPFVDRHRSLPAKASDPLKQHAATPPYLAQSRSAPASSAGLVIAVFAVVLFLLLGGLGAYLLLVTDEGTLPGTARPTAAKSRFYSSASDLKALVERCKPDAGLTIKSIAGPWSSGGHHGRDLRHDRGIRCVVDGDRKVVAGFLFSLKEEFESTARANGVVISGIEHRKRIDGLTSFKLPYSVGDAHGQVEVEIKNGPINADATRLEDVHIVVTMEEWVRPTAR